jgi:hypothetical protein
MLSIAIGTNFELYLPIHDLYSKSSCKKEKFKNEKDGSIVELFFRNKLLAFLINV